MKICNYLKSLIFTTAFWNTKLSFFVYIILFSENFEIHYSSRFNFTLQNLGFSVQVKTVERNNLSLH